MVGTVRFGFVAMLLCAVAGGIGTFTQGGAHAGASDCASASGIDCVVSTAGSELAPVSASGVSPGLLAVDFGANGLWRYDGTTWTRLSTLNAGVAGLAGWRGGLAADFDGSGIFSHNGTAWQRLSTWDPDHALAGWSSQGQLAIDFGATGLWNRSGTTWTRLSTWDALALAGWGERLAAGFAGQGTWIYDGTRWQRLSTWTPGDGGLSGWSGGLAVDFDGNGLWNRTENAWRRLSTWDVGAGGLSGWSQGLALDFGTNGLWTYNGETSTWRRLSTWPIGAGGAQGWSGGLAVDFGANGLWSYDGARWTRLSTWRAEGLAATGGVTPPPVMLRLNDTGIDWCASGDANDLPCPVDGYSEQDGQSGRDATNDDDSDGHAGFSFTKLDGDGNALSASATVWSCVRDDVTGLVWEVKTDDDGLRDQDWSYTWYNPDPGTNGGDAGTQNGGFCSGSACDTHAFVQAVNAAGLCGASDWRLPRRSEFISIVSYDRIFPSIDTDYLPDTHGFFSFWSSSPYARYSGYAWIVDFYYGGVAGHGKSNTRYVRLVRAGQ